jgi:phosphate transport system substrate-binding protein
VVADRRRGPLRQTIIRVSRQSNSGTYEFVRDHVLGKGRDFKLGSRDMQGSKDVVDLVSHTPCAIGYSGIGYGNDQVKVSHLRQDREPCVEPTMETAFAVVPRRAPCSCHARRAEGPIAEYLD